ncbi:MAG: discoidin domain-containing protein [Bacteroidales bacterium]
MKNNYFTILSMALIWLCWQPLNAQNNVEVYSVSKNKPTLNNLQSTQFKEIGALPTSQNLIRVFSGDQKQKLIGVGGAFTESSISVIRTLPKEKQDEIFNAYFGKNGAQYSLIRTHIGSCDFSTHYYSYDETPNDWDLKNFSFKDEEKFVLPAVKQALSINPNIKIFAAPWSPPAWMKKSGEMYAGGTGSFSKRDNSLRDDCYDVYARYLAKYIQEYKKNGINIFSLSLQNESQNNSNWEGCTYSIDQTIRIIRDYLGPTLKKNNLDTKLIIWDWDKQVALGRGDGMKDYCYKVLRDPKVAQYIYGVGFHWYAFDLAMHKAGEDPWSINDFGSIDYVKNRFPNMHMVATEACYGGPPRIGKWKPASRYIFDIINDLAHNAEGWIDWNVVLNQWGSPCHDGIPNCGHAPIMVNTNTKEIYYNPSYYVMKLFGRNIRPGGHVISSTFNTWTDNNVSYINQVSVQNPDGSITVFVANNLDETYDIEIADGQKSFKYTLAPNSLTAFKYFETANERNDLVDGKMAFSSDVEHGYNPSHVTDLKLNTRWASEWTDNQWLTIYMDEEQLVSSVSSLWENGSRNDYEILYLAKDGSWKKVDYLSRLYTNSRLNISGPYPFYKRNYDIKSTEVSSNKIPLHIDFFKPIKTQAISIHGYKRHEKYGYSIYKVKVSGPYNPNLLYRDKLDTYASSVEYDNYPNLVLDNDHDSRWASDWNDNQSITFDAGKKCHFTGMSIKFENAKDCDFEIQVSDDNKNFTKVSYKKNRFWEYTKVSLDSNIAVGRYIRFQGIHKNARYGYSMRNVSIGGHYENNGLKSRQSFNIEVPKIENTFSSSSNKSIQVYPNPIVNHQLTIVSNNIHGNGNIFDINGNKIKDLKINKGTNVFQIDITPGVYLFKMDNAKANDVNKIIIK